jgi:HK97 family phage prohead protease
MSETVFFPAALEIKRAGNTTPGEFEGHASVFGNVDRDGDIIQRGAFRLALQKHDEDRSKPTFLFNHNHSQAIGTILDVREDETGLWFRAKVITTTKLGAETWELIKENGVYFSLGFRIAANGATRRSDGVRVIQQIDDLLEISAVTLPANPRAKVLSLKDSKRNLEHFLCDAGLPRAAAKKICSGGYNALVHRDDGLTRDVDALHARLDSIEKLLEKSR